MNTVRRSVITWLALACTTAALAGPTYEIDWHTIDGGGVLNATGGNYELSGTIGQPDASNPATGGSYSLVGGFWGIGDACIGDLNGDSLVNLDDLQLLLFNFGTLGPAGDVDGDNDCDLDDLQLMLFYFGTIC
ncbi:MAG: hypothetical protein KDA20_12810 [Phycisphaerales bacterium]|nr:hypothetical protein [Phycisphaerales bacterium]